MKKRPIGQDIHITSTAIESYIDQKIMNQGDNALTGIEGMTLGFLAKKEKGITIKEVMEHFHIVKSTASQTLSSLERKGMITMEEDFYDHRKKVISLTEKGILKNKELDQKFDEMNQIIERGFKEEEKTMIHSLLGKIRFNLGLEY